MASGGPSLGRHVYYGVFEMKIGGDLFKILNIVIRIIRMFAEIFGDDEDREAVAQSRERSVNHNAEETC